MSVLLRLEEGEGGEREEALEEEFDDDDGEGKAKGGAMMGKIRPPCPLFPQD